MTRVIARVNNAGVAEKIDSGIDEFSAKYHSKRSCRRCHERGWHGFSMKDGSIEVRTCECVERNLAKALAPTQEFVYGVRGPKTRTDVYYGTASKKYSEVTQAL